MFLIRISCKKKTVIIKHLIEAIGSFELDIINVSHVTINTSILTTVLAEVPKHIVFNISNNFIYSAIYEGFAFQ